MRWLFQVVTGPRAGEALAFAPDGVARIGRAPEAEHVIDDRLMSGLHFAVGCRYDQCRLQDLGSSNGTLVNDRPGSQFLLRDGDQVRAGSSYFLVRYIDESVPPPDWKPALLALLRGTAQPLWAVLDAARDERILPLLVESQPTCQSLFEGRPSATLAHCAPYLVLLPPEIPLLETLVEQGWGNSWGVFLRSRCDFYSLRHQLRRLLTVDADGIGRVVFRFYDPRVLREFLPVATPEQQAAFFAAGETFYVESALPHVCLRYTAGTPVVRQALGVLDRPSTPVPEGR